MRVAVCISGWLDTELLRGCVESVAEFGWPVTYADGAYRLFLGPDDKPTPTDEAELEDALESVDWCTLSAPLPLGVWESEAKKKTELARVAMAQWPDAEWLLFLDTDERIEAPSGLAALESAWPDRFPDQMWASLNIYRPDHPHNPDGFPLPRLLRADPSLEFRPPRDFDAYRDGERIAFLDGERVPESMVSRHSWIHPRYLRIRHERRLRPVERADMTGRYCQRRREMHGCA